MTSEPMRLYTQRGSSASLRVKFFLGRANVPTTLVQPIEMDQGVDDRGIPAFSLPHGDPVTEELGTTDLKAFNPEGRIPVLLLPDGRKMTQSGAIIDYIRALNGPDGMVPDDPWLQAEMRRIMWIIAADVQPYQNVPFITQAMLDWGMVEGHPLTHPLRQHFIRREFGALNGIMGHCAGTCAVGDTVTLADCFLLPQIRNALLAEIDLPNEFPVLSRVFDHVCDQPGIAEVIEDAGGKVQPMVIDREKLAAKLSARD
ncbi:MAG: glutathione S-transferase N-terminal domain-containing protein [Pseudomonadota bacterium]